MDTTTRCIAIAATAMALLVPAVARAQVVATTAEASRQPYASPAPRRLVGWIQLGRARAYGDVSGAQGDTVGNMFGGRTQSSLLGALGGRISPSLVAVGYLGVDSTATGSGSSPSCSDSWRLDCTALTVRLGIAGNWRPLPGATLQPWLGLGAGVLVTTANGTRDGSHFSDDLVGLELGRLSAGLDYVFSSRIGLGLYAEYAFDRYLARHHQGAIDGAAVNRWFSSGLRISWN